MYWKGRAMHRIEAWGIGGFVAFLLVLNVGILVAAFVYLPVELSAQAACLAKGFPRAQVTWNFDRYCTTLDGAVTVRVEPQ